MPKDVIKIEYETMNELASLFEELSERCQIQQRHVQDKLQICMAGGWEGDNADNFYRRIEDEVQPAQRRLIHALRSAQEVIQEICRIMTAAEYEAAQYFQYDDTAHVTNGAGSSPMPQIHSSSQTQQPQTIFVQDTNSFEAPISFNEDGTVAYSVDGSSADGMESLLTNSPEANANQSGVLLTGDGIIIGRSDMNPYLVLVRVSNAQGAGYVWVDLQNSPGITLPESLDNIPLIATSQVIEAEAEKLEKQGLEQFVTGLDGWYVEAPQNIEIMPIASADINGVIQFGVKDSTLYGSLPDWRHPGIDIIADAGTPVYSLTNGEVVGVYIPDETVLPNGTPYIDASGRPLVGGVFDPGNTAQGIGGPENQVSAGISTDNSHGAYVVVRTGDTYVVYEHLDPSSIQVGEYVLRGQPIGTVGDFTANDPTWGNHLHLEVRIHDANVVPIYNDGSYQPSAQTPSLIINPQVMFDDNYWQSTVIPIMSNTTFGGTNTNPNVVNSEGNIVQNTWGINIGSRNLFQVNPSGSNLSWDINTYVNESNLEIAPAPIQITPTPTQEA